MVFVSLVFIATLSGVMNVLVGLLDRAVKRIKKMLNKNKKGKDE